MPLLPTSPRPEMVLLTLVRTDVPDGRRINALALVNVICPPPVRVSEPAMFNQVPAPVESTWINPRLAIFPLRVSWLLLPTMTVDLAPINKTPVVGIWLSAVTMSPPAIPLLIQTVVVSVGIPLLHIDELLQLPVPPVQLSVPVAGHAAAAAAVRLNVAVTLCAWLIVTTHEPEELVQAPLQPAKVEFDVGAAVSVTTVPPA